MCMSSRVNVTVPEMKAYKVLARDRNSLLHSVFVPTFKPGLRYPANERIRVDTEEANFFAFGEFKHAVSVARAGRRTFNMVSGDLIVLPVTLYEVVVSGTYRVPSDDPQCMDGYYPAFESKEIVVHDNRESRKQFYDATLSQWFRMAKYSMSEIERESVLYYMPQLANV